MISPTQAVRGNDRRAHLRETRTITGLMNHLGVRPESETDTGWLYSAPYRADENPSMTVSKTNPQIFRDWSTGDRGDIFDLVRLINGGDTPFGTILDVVEEMPQDPEALEAYATPAEREPLDQGKVEWLLSECKPVHSAGRIYTDFTHDKPAYYRVDEHKIPIESFDDRLVHVNWKVGEDRQALGVKFRYADGSKVSMRGSSNGLFSPRPWDPPLFRDGSYLLICEGESDTAIASVHSPHVVVGVTGVTVEPTEAVCEPLHGFAGAYICFDSDTAGREAADRWAATLAAHVGMASTIIELPEGYDLASLPLDQWPAPLLGKEPT